MPSRRPVLELHIPLELERELDLLAADVGSPPDEVAVKLLVDVIGGKNAARRRWRRGQNGPRDWARRLVRSIGMTETCERTGVDRGVIEALVRGEAGAVLGLSKVERAELQVAFIRLQLATDLRAARKVAPRYDDKREPGAVITRARGDGGVAA